MSDYTTRKPRKLLADIVSDGEAAGLREAWERTEAAGDFAPLPAGEYVARVVGGELVKSKNGTLGYKIAFKVFEGEHAGRMLWCDLWLTPSALPMSKRDLHKLGVTDWEQLEQPLRSGICCRVKVVVRRGDDGTERNHVRGFEVIGIDADPYVDPDFGPGVAPPAEGAP